MLGAKDVINPWKKRLYPHSKYKHKKTGLVRTTHKFFNFFGSDYVSFREGGRMVKVKNFFKHYTRVRNDEI